MYKSNLQSVLKYSDYILLYVLGWNRGNLSHVDYFVKQEATIFTTTTTTTTTIAIAINITNCYYYYLLLLLLLLLLLSLLLLLLLFLL